MAASSGRTAGALLWKCANCCSSFNVASSRIPRQVFSRQICLNAAPLQRKNLASVGPEKFSEEFIKKQVEEFDIGKRHLANMMGADPETFTQQDIDRSIAYLFPSGLFEKKARPMMKHPDEVYPKQRAVQWGKDGRPFHFLFYTGKPNYYQLMHDTYEKMLSIEKRENHLRTTGLFSTETKPLSLAGSRWLFKEELEELLQEIISEHDYTHFIQLMERRLLALPYCALEEEFVLRYRKQLVLLSSKQDVPALEHDEQGRAFSTAEGRRKTARCSVVLKDSGSGAISINGIEYINYFPILQDREQLMFPFLFVDMLGRFDLQCSVSGGGRSSQAGALRLAISRSLLSFLSEGQVENMRQAGLLTPDPRVRERKKPGQEGARRKFAWNKR